MTDETKRYSVKEFTYTYYDSVGQKNRSVHEFGTQFDSLADIETQLECPLGQIVNLTLKVMD